MNISSRAASQLHALDATDCASVLDTLRDTEIGPGSHLIEIVTPGQTAFRCFVARHRDGSLVLLGVLESRPRAP